MAADTELWTISPFGGIWHGRWEVRDDGNCNLISFKADYTFSIKCNVHKILMDISQNMYPENIPEISPSMGFFSMCA